MNRTHLEHATVAVLMALGGMALSAFTNHAVLILACAYPAICFFFREQGQRTVHLCNGRPITWRITLEACKFWRWGPDAYWDFAATVPPLIVIFFIVEG